MFLDKSLPHYNCLYRNRDGECALSPWDNINQKFVKCEQIKIYEDNFDSIGEYCYERYDRRYDNR